MKSIIHILTDYKFIDNHMEMYSDEYFTNQIIFIGDLSRYTGKYDSRISTFEIDDIDQICNMCEKADLVTLNNLSGVQAVIATKISEKVKLAWRFFGTELYSTDKKRYLSDTTINILRPSFFNLKFLIGRIKNLGNKLNHEKKHDSVDLQIISKKISLFFALSEEEYRFLNEKYFILPEFVKLPHPNIKIEDVDFYSFRDTVVVGNNRYPINNHIDILKIIKKNCINFNVELPFSYGPSNYYSKYIKDYSQKITNVKVIDKFIAYEEFHTFYCDKAALVINGYRQMAGRNIYLALKSGAKVYIRSNNPHYSFLKNQGFLIFTIDDFKKDVVNNSLNLTPKERHFNHKNMNRFSLRYDQVKFSEKLYAKI